MSGFVFVRNVWFRFCTKCLILVFVRDVVCTKCRVYELSCPLDKVILLGSWISAENSDWKVNVEQAFPKLEMRRITEPSVQIKIRMIIQN